MLELVSIKKQYVTKAGNTQALDDINLTFPSTGLVFITGKSGSGKTTLLNIIGGLDSFDSGEIRLNGKSFSKFSELDFDSYRNTFIGFVFQEYNLLPEYNIEKNINIALELQGQDNNPDVTNSLLDSMEISGLENRKPNQLSGGQKQRVSIARALVKNPKIILADELTGALDSVTGEQVMQILKRLSKEKLVIVVSHDLELAEKFADRIIKISDGRIVDDVTFNEIELQGNIHQSDNNLTVKVPSVLTGNENKILLEAIRSDYKISFTKKISWREKVKTVQPTSIEKQDVKLIDSKMKFASAFSLGFKSIKTKPIRLIMTILLSVIAFSVFGLFDAIASFSNAKVIASLLKEGIYQSLPVYASYSDGEYYNKTNLKLSQSQIDAINEENGYSFRGVYDINDNDILRNTTREGYNASVEFSGIPLEKYYDSNDYYTKNANGIISFSQAEIDEDNNIDKEGFNFKILYGSYPKIDVNSSVQQVAISSYFAESILFYIGNKKSDVNGKKIEGVKDLIGVEIHFNDFTFVITGIIDCGEIPKKFDLLKTKVDNALKSDLRTFLASGCYLNLFVADGLIEYLRNAEEYSVNYYPDYKNNIQKISIGKNEYEFTNCFYNVSNLKLENNYLFFDSDKTNLEAGEALISINDLTRTYSKNEFNTGDTSQLLPARNLLDASVSVSDIKSNLASYLQILENVQRNNSLEINASKTIKINMYKRKSLNLIDESELKIVGIYFNINSYSNKSPNSKVSSLVINEETMANIHIETNQGIFSRAISPINSSRQARRSMGELMNNESTGFNLNWYENSILNTVANERGLIEQALNLVLCLAIILAIFSAFMLFNYISISISSKRQTIGILRTLGANKKNIFIMFITEALIISLIISFFACIFTYFACMLVNNYLIGVMNLTLNIAMFDFRQILIIFIAGILTGVASTILPIIKISKKKPVELIRTI